MRPPPQSELVERRPGPSHGIAPRIALTLPSPDSDRPVEFEAARSKRLVNEVSSSAKIDTHRLWEGCARLS